MKKIVVMLLVTVMCISMSGCGSNRAFKTSKEAYENISIAYGIAEEYGEDIYEAWRLGIYEKKSIDVEFLADELNLSEDEIVEGIVYCYFSLVSDKDYEDATEEEKEELRDATDVFFEIYSDNVFDGCVAVVTGVYSTNGKVEKAQKALDDAKNQMKQLSEKYSDYEHYPSLKEYYTTTNSFFDFCQNPTGSFEQVKETINDYRNEARDCQNDLDYIFE